MVVPRNDKAWMAMYEQLAAYKALVGHCYLTKARTTGHSNFRKLANWIARQRKAEPKMPPHRKQLLDDLGFYWNAHDYLWFCHFHEVKEIYDRVGHCDIPMGRLELNEQNKCYEKYIAWAREQRLQYAVRKNGHRGMMSDRRLEALRSIGFKLELESEEYQNKVKSCVTHKVVNRMLRHIPHWRVREVFDAIEKEKQHYKATQEVRPVILESSVKELIQVEKDSSWRLVLIDCFEGNVEIMTGAGIGYCTD